MHPKKRRSEDRIALYPTSVPAVSLGLLMLFVAAALGAALGYPGV